VILHSKYTRPLTFEIFFSAKALADMNDMTILPGDGGGGSVHGGGGGGVADMTLVSSSFPERKPPANNVELCGVGVILEQASIYIHTHILFSNLDSAFGEGSCSAYASAISIS
jgi:hypothetical protein